MHVYYLLKEGDVNMAYGDRRFQNRNNFQRRHGSQDRMRMEMRPSSVKTAFQNRNATEQIMIIKGFDEVIRVRIGDTVKIGSAIYRIVEYNPRKEWQKRHDGAKVNASVKCKLERGEVIPDLRSVSRTDPATGEIFIEICAETFSHFYIPWYKRKEMEEQMELQRLKQREERIQKEREQIQAERDRKQREFEERQRAKVFNGIQGIDKLFKK